MKKFGLLTGLLLLVSSLTASVADASVISLTASDPLQLGRLSRNGIPQDWAGDEPYPGVINATTPYHFHAFSLDVGIYQYIDVIVDGTSTTTFVSAYQSSYHPSNLSIGWLGDPGTSGNYFSGTDALFFDVVAALNSQLVLVLNESVTNGGLGVANGPNVTITGYACNDFSCDGVDLTGRLSAFATVIPEPATWLLLAGPLAGLVITRRRKAKPVVA